MSFLISKLDLGECVGELVLICGEQMCEKTRLIEKINSHCEFNQSPRGITEKQTLLEVKQSMLHYGCEILLIFGPLSDIELNIINNRLEHQKLTALDFEFLKAYSQNLLQPYSGLALISSKIQFTILPHNISGSYKNILLCMCV
jgi:hypothetical protein